MRAPTTTAVLYAWHRAAMKGEQIPRHDDDPQCGWYRTRMVKGGPWVPVEIRCRREIDPATGELTTPEELVCDCGGEKRSAANLWTFLMPISRRAHEALVQMQADMPAMMATHAKIEIPVEAIQP